jgi:hypothetical protein
MVEGYPVSLKGDEFRVSPGVAFDCMGRELILTEEAAVMMPDELKESFILIDYYEMEICRLTGIDQSGDSANTGMEERVNGGPGLSDFMDGYSRTEHGWNACTQAHPVPIAKYRDGKITTPV